jgi:hypothetical protein
MDAALSPISPSLPWALRWQYPRHYPWFITLAGLDILLTWIVLSLGGQELNAVARLALDLAGIPGMIALKLAAVFIVCAVCEYAGRRKPHLGRGVANLAIAANTIPVTVACLCLTQFVLGLLESSPFRH